MSNPTFIAENDLTIECENGSIEYKKGQVVHIEVDEKDDPYLSYHQEDADGKVTAFEIDITTLDMFNSLMENLITEEDLEENVDYVEMEIDDLLFNEGVNLEALTCYMAEVARKKITRFSGGKRTRISVPVRKRKKRPTAAQKRARIKQVRALARSPKAKRNRMRSMKARSRQAASNHVIAHDLLLQEDSEALNKYTAAKLEAYFGENAEVSLHKDVLKVAFGKKATMAHLEEALQQAEVNFKIEERKGGALISLVVPESTPVVESYYAVEADCDDKEDDDKEDLMEMCAGYYKEMKHKMKEMEESDIDMEKAEKMLEAYGKKLEKMKEMDKEGKALEGLYKEMEGDYHKFMKMMDGPGEETEKK